MSPRRMPTCSSCASTSAVVARFDRSGTSFTVKTLVGRPVSRMNCSIGLSASAASMLAFQIGPGSVPPKTWR